MAIWNSLKDKAKKLADEATNAAKDLATEATEKAKDIASNIAEEVGDISHAVAAKAEEAWNSEEAIRFKENAQKFSTSTKDFAVDTAGKAKKMASNIADEVGDISHAVVAKAEEAWNSEEAERLKDNAKRLSLKAKEIADSTGQSAVELWNSDNMQKVRSTSLRTTKVITGMQAVEDRKKSIKNREEADQLKAQIEQTNEELRLDMNEALEEFGKFRLETLSDTVGKFLRCLEIMNQRAKGKEYEFLSEIDIKVEEVKEMEAVDMKASDALRTLAVGGGFAAVGVLGTPAVVTSAVTAMCAASTGTAISSLSGAAATNAVLAWLGGGSLAAGGGGVAAGTVVLGAITATATVGLAVVAVGTLASKFYAKKNTESEAYLADIKIWAEEMQTSWTVLAGIKQRIGELHDLTQKLKDRSAERLAQLEEIAPSFDSNNENHVKLFQQCAIMAKSMSELAQTPMLDEDGNLSEQSSIVAGKTNKILNTEL